MISFQCSNCHRSLKAPDQAIGKKTRCPKCSTTMRIPRITEMAAIDVFQQATGQSGGVSMALDSRERKGKDSLRLYFVMAASGVVAITVVIVIASLLIAPYPQPNSFQLEAIETALSCCSPRPLFFRHD